MMHDAHDIDVRVYSKAKREAQYYGITNPDDCRRLEDSIRYREFRLAIEPYERMRNKPLLDWWAIQVSPGVEQPQWLKEHVALFDEMIAAEARRFGYTDKSDT